MTAFIPDNISAHVHLLEDNDPIKKTKMAAVSWVFSVWLIFHKNNKSVSAKIMTGLSLSILSAEKSQSIQLFQVVVLILEAAITFFSVQVATTTVCKQWPTRVFVNHSKDAFV